MFSRSILQLCVHSGQLRGQNAHHPPRNMEKFYHLLCRCPSLEEPRWYPGVLVTEILQALLGVPEKKLSQDFNSPYGSSTSSPLSTFPLRGQIFGFLHQCLYARDQPQARQFVAAPSALAGLQQRSPLLGSSASV